MLNDLILSRASPLPRPHFIRCPNSAGVIPGGKLVRIKSATSSIEWGAADIVFYSLLQRCAR